MTPALGQPTRATIAACAAFYASIGMCTASVDGPMAAERYFVAARQLGSDLTPKEAAMGMRSVWKQDQVACSDMATIISRWGTCAAFTEEFRVRKFQ
jgi:hypothetical protein